MKLRKESSREEAEIVEVIRLGLELSGFIVVRVNQRNASLGGTDVCGDLLVSHASFPAGVWVMGEVKTQTGKLSKRRISYRNGSFGRSQQDLFDEEKFFLWRNAEEALHDCVRVQKGFEMLLTKG